MIIAVDTGGTKTLVTSFDDDGQPNEEFRFPTPEDSAEYIRELKKILSENFFSKGVQPEAIVIAMPGIVQNNILQEYRNGWHDLNVPDLLKDITASPIWMENDANLGGLGEANLLSPIPASCLYVTISTGIGTGIILNGMIAPGLERSEGGHVYVQYEGKQIRWEALASGKVIKETYNSYARDIKDPQIWHEIAVKISKGFLELIPILQPDVIVIGGSIGTYFDSYKDDLLQELRTDFKDIPFIKVPEIRRAAHPEEAVVYGCYNYAKQQLAR